MITMVEKSAINAKTYMYNFSRSILRHGREKALVISAIFLGGIIGPAPVIRAAQIKPDNSLTVNAAGPIEAGVRSMVSGIAKNDVYGLLIAIGLTVAVWGATEFEKYKIGIRNENYTAQNNRQKLPNNIRL